MRAGGFLILRISRTRMQTIDHKGGSVWTRIGARIYKNKGLAKVGPTQMGVWRKLPRRFPYFSEARIYVLPTFLNLGSTISVLFEYNSIKSKVGPAEMHKAA